MGRKKNRNKKKKKKKVEEETPQTTNYRFKVGDKVICLANGWMAGTVVQSPYQDGYYQEYEGGPYTDVPVWFPYQIELEDKERIKRTEGAGELVYASQDTDEYIRSFDSFLLTMIESFDENIERNIKRYDLSISRKSKKCFISCYQI